MDCLVHRGLIEDFELIDDFMIVDLLDYINIEYLLLLLYNHTHYYYCGAMFWDREGKGKER